MPLPVLTVVIPALDEEQAIGDTIRRTLAAREGICREAGLSEVEIFVVSDGSTDRTEEIACSFDEVNVLTFVQNRGYGAAIQAGFAHGRGDLLGFLDADGTCDPATFGRLARACVDGADIALGNRMVPGGDMPRVRALGNHLFAWILGVLSQRAVADTASGMRVLRRRALPELEPLPDGLHFTPAMSAKALLSGRLELVEIPMAYAERVGRSKLSVLRDGVRFLRCIVGSAVLFRPDRPLLLAARVAALAALLLALGPTWHWLATGSLEEWMVYRVLAATLGMSLAAILVNGGLVAEAVAAQAHGRPSVGAGPILRNVLGRRGRTLVCGASLCGALLSSWPGLVQYVTTGHVTMHWSRAVLSLLLVLLAGILGVTSFLLQMVQRIRDQQDGGRPPRAPERVRLVERGGP